MKVFSLFFLCIFAIALFYNYYEDSSAKLIDEPIIAKELSEPIPQTSTALITEEVDASLDEIKLAFIKCSSSTPIIDDYSEMINKQVSEFSEKQLAALYSVVDDKLEFCEKWESSLDNLTNQQIIGFETDKQNSKNRFNDFIKLNSNEKLEVATSVLKGEDNSIGKNLAISYTLKYDLDFARELANKVGTENIDMVVNNRREILSIYKCQNDLTTCNSKSSRMVALCSFNEEYCEIDYFAYLDKSRTGNEVNDLYNLSNALRELLEGNF